jgi:RNA polymerase sigma-70 factor (ECF subfamily)
MKRSDRTEMGGSNEAFDETQWSVILDTRSQDTARRRAAIEQLLARYWKPVYCYLRRKGNDNESAKDLTQSFFHEVVLGRALAQQADRSRGRFRTFLLTALDRYVTSAHRADTAQKRRPASGLASLEAVGPAGLPEPESFVSPEDAFHHAWASALLDEALSDTAKELAKGGKDVHWQVFRARVIVPIMDGTPPPSLSELCACHRIASEDAASNMIVTAKRRFQATLRRRIRRFVSSDEEIDAEIDDLLKILARGRAGG